MTIASQRPEGMIAGILTFIALYVVLDYATRGTSIRANSGIRLTLKIAYWTRMIISILLPIGMYIDVFAGMFAAMVLGVSPEGNARNLPATQAFVISYFMTLLTGVFINLLVFVYMVIVFTLLSLYRLMAYR